MKEAALFGNAPARGRAARGARPPTRSAGCWPSGAISVERIEKIVPSLEDVFVSLIEARDRAEQPQEEVPR